ncbi:MAG: hypothetical protein SNJ62_12985 [Chloracidobacterium sp.]
MKNRRDRLRIGHWRTSRRISSGTSGNLAHAAALTRLRQIKQRFARYIGRTYGHLAADCAVCPTPCCADAQFVNVNIVRLEAEAMLETLGRSQKHGPGTIQSVITRARAAITKYGLTEHGDTFATTYACPLFEPGVGCLVHWKAKPAACIQHGCYERWEDLPETKTQRAVERQVAALDEAVHGTPSVWLPIPLWLARLAPEASATAHATTNDDA